MPTDTQIIDLLKQLKASAPAGFALALHINYTRPTFLFQTYPEDWIKEYSEKGMVMADPTVHWGFENEGTKRWSALADQDPSGVLSKAAVHGMKYGVACALTRDDTHSLGSFARSDKEFSDSECDALLDKTRQIHVATEDLNTLVPDIYEAIKILGIQCSQPGGR